jgi:manganese/zinc/iron transport system permease protein
MTLNDFWILATAIVVALVCAIPGTFLVLRRMSMVGDAISHAVLPGIVIAYLISGSRSSVAMLPGAAAAGMFVAVAIEWLQKKLRVRDDAAIGLVYTFLFAVGVILVSAFTAQTDLDQDCVLYGEIAFVPFDLITLSENVFFPRQLLVGTVLLILILLVLIRGFRGLYLSTFDPGYAMSIGVSVAFWHYVLMGMVSFATVVSFESVGAILVVALLSGPAASAALFARSLKSMILMSCVFGSIAAVTGYFAAVWLNVSIAGSIAMFTGIIYFISLLLKRIIHSF